ncbi:ATP-binding cassette domain-containing protein [Kiloniella sp. EL199]|uniref:ATP-binding cassette domain-containing protein n=1 Tax=Kiloniella sp. EL199 TaxID=2107581 RepID=UPI000EA3AD55|nr:ATP-binding cassette domain-containing protein [Kiloniella sp. EL199]
MVDSPLFKLDHLTICQQGNDHKPIIDDVSFSLTQGQRLGLIGRSGCGKSVTSHAIMDILRPPLIRKQGQAVLQGQDIFTLPDMEKRRIRGQGIFCIFQSPGSALHPALTIQQQMMELSTVIEQSPTTVTNAIEYAFDRMQLPLRCLTQYPHHLSGGMKQRVLMAMALLLKPRFLIADEPTTGLDVLTERDVIDTMEIMLEETQAACLFISHDIRIVKRVCPDLLVMQDGKIVDRCTRDELTYRDRAETTREIIDAMKVA